MKTPTFMEGVIVAVIASVVGSVGYFALSGIFSDGFVARLLVSGFSLGYILYLLKRSKERVGRVTTVLVWFVTTIALWLSWPSITFFVLIHLMMVWLVRSLYFYSSLFSSLADLVLQGFALAFAIWAFYHSGSLLLSLWCFFLVQALFVLIPAGTNKKTATASINDLTNQDQTNNEADFQRAYREAENAVRKLSTH